ncbi:MAG: hypothetical protein IKX23_07470 [Treponema sp.]|nr:hypothetical protein [Treponema sp.]
MKKLISSLFLSICFISLYAKAVNPSVYGAEVSFERDRVTVPVFWQKQPLVFTDFFVNDNGFDYAVKKGPVIMKFGSYTICVSKILFDGEYIIFPEGIVSLRKMRLSSGNAGSSAKNEFIAFVNLKLTAQGYAGGGELEGSGYRFTKDSFVFSSDKLFFCEKGICGNFEISAQDSSKDYYFNISNAVVGFNSDFEPWYQNYSETEKIEIEKKGVCKVNLYNKYGFRKNEDGKIEFYSSNGEIKTGYKSSEYNVPHDDFYCYLDFCDICFTGNLEDFSSGICRYTKPVLLKSENEEGYRFAVQTAYLKYNHDSPVFLGGLIYDGENIENIIETDENGAQFNAVTGKITFLADIPQKDTLKN